eukprot:6125520-Heterocapsa_arctica.AAC.1
MWEAQAHQCRSPAWQWRMFHHKYAVPLPSGVRAFADGGLKPLVSLVAEHAVFSLPKSTLDQLAGHVGVFAQKDCDLLASLMSLLEHMLPDHSHEEHLNIAERRLGAMKREMSSCV